MVEFFAPSPLQAGAAANALDSATAPTVFSTKFGCIAQFYNHLSKTGVLKDLSRELGLSFTLDERFTLHGPQKQQGEFLRRVGEYLDAFQKVICWCQF